LIGIAELVLYIIVIPLHSLNVVKALFLFKA